MSESTPTSSTGTAKSPAEGVFTGESRYALELHVLVLRVREIGQQFLNLTHARYADCMTIGEVNELRCMYTLAERLEADATKLEEQWRVRQGLSRKS